MAAGADGEAGVPVVVKSIAIIPARGGSRRIPQKNRRGFLGAPIMAYSIHRAEQSQCFERIVVSTDCETIAKIARHYGVEVHERDDAHARDEVGTQEVTRQVLVDLEWGEDYACCIYPTAPLMLPSDLLLGWRMLTEHAKTNYVVAVAEVDALCDAGQWYWGRTQAFLDRLRLGSRWTRLFPLPCQRVCDINEPGDWDKAEQLYAELWPVATRVC